MKIFLSLFFFVCPIIAFAQEFTLEPVSASNLENFYGFSSFSDNDIPVGTNDSGESVTVYFFNPDFSFRKSITVTPTINNIKGTFWLEGLESAANLGNTFAASQHLFNEDDLFEFAVYGYIADGKDEFDNEVRLWAYFIYNENGQLLGSIPSSMLYPIGGFVYFKDYQDGITSFVKLVTNNSGNVQVPYISRNNVKISPNPVSSCATITFTFDNPVEPDCNVTVIGSDGRLVLKQNVPAGITSLDFDASRLAKGVNIVNLIRGVQVLETGKVLVY